MRVRSPASNVRRVLSQSDVVTEMLADVFVRHGRGVIARP